jgi:uncharacterized coiled-coil protein SlyX
MTDQLDDDWSGEAQPVRLQRRRRAPAVLAVFAVLAVVGVGVGLFWLNFDLGFSRLLGRESTGSAEPASGDKAMMTDMLATQQKTSEDLETLKGAVADQEEQLKTIVDQLAALTSRLEEMRSAAAPAAPAASAVPAQPSAAGAPPDVRAQAAPKAAKKKPKPAGPISVGGAPLTAAPRADGR